VEDCSFSPSGVDYIDHYFFVLIRLRSTNVPPGIPDIVVQVTVRGTALVAIPGIAARSV
jgi:hypothetical protein